MTNWNNIGFEWVNEPKPDNSAYVWDTKLKKWVCSTTGIPVKPYWR